MSSVAGGTKSSANWLSGHYVLHAKFASSQAFFLTRWQDRMKNILLKVKKKQNRLGMLGANSLKFVMQPSREVNITRSTWLASSPPIPPDRSRFLEVSMDTANWTADFPHIPYYPKSFLAQAVIDLTLRPLPKRKKKSYKNSSRTCSFLLILFSSQKQVALSVKYCWNFYNFSLGSDIFVKKKK